MSSIKDNLPLLKSMTIECLKKLVTKSEAKLYLKVMQNIYKHSSSRLVLLSSSGPNTNP